MRFVLKISYDGTNYCGWQWQPNAQTVQETLETELTKIIGEAIKLNGCGRTDKGVHAINFIAHFDCEELPSRFLFRINRMLPADIAVDEIFEVTNEFHSRFSATYRKYVYKATFVKRPFLRNETLFLFKEPNLDLMNKACEVLIKTKDFASFCKSGADNKTTLCDLMEAKWIETQDGLEFHVKANRFLRNMVRALVGTLLEIGYSNVSLKDLEKIIESKNRSESGKSVAARGLFLVEIGYNWDEFRK